eukprot:UN24321
MCQNSKNKGENMWAATSYLILALIFIFIGWEVNSVYFAVVFYWSALSLILVSGAYILIWRKFLESVKMASSHFIFAGHLCLFYWVLKFTMRILASTIKSLPFKKL